MFAKASNTAFGPYQVRMTAEALAPELPVVPSCLCTILAEVPIIVLRRQY